MKTFGCGVGVGCHDAAAGAAVDCFIVPTCAAWGSAKWTIAGTLGCVFIDNETHESGVTKCTTGEAWSAFS